MKTLHDARGGTPFQDHAAKLWNQSIKQAQAKTEDKPAKAATAIAAGLGGLLVKD